VANLTNLTSLSLQHNQVNDISPLAKLTNLTVLDLWNNHITDISPLANLTRLTYLYLQRNQISDISPLVDNEGISAGDEVYLSDNPLSSDSIKIYIPQLQARGVTVSY
jgi:internalin A